MSSAATLKSPAFGIQDSVAERHALFEIIHHFSFGRGDITLSSGRKSDFYFDMKPSMLDPEGAFLMARILLAEVLAVGGEYVGGLEMGAVPITGAICLLSHTVGNSISGFFVRKKAKEHGARKRVEGFKANETMLGKKIVIIDDVTTSGASALSAVEACQKEGAEVRLVISIVDRCEGAQKAFEEKGIPFKSIFNATEFVSK